MPDKKFIQDLNSLIRPSARKALPAAPVRGTLAGSTKTVTLGASPSAAVGDVVELYRVVSKIVTDPDGNWEFPVGFPTTNTYPGHTGGPDTSTYLVSERTHELASLTTDGSHTTSQSPGDWEQPFTGDGTYDPAYELIKNTTAPAGFETAMAGVDWTTIEADVAARYPGITI